MNGVKISGYIPGAIGRITELHAIYYNKHWNFGLFFESKVATEMSEFLNRFNEAQDGFWVATVGEPLIGRFGGMVTNGFSQHFMNILVIFNYHFF